MIIAINKPKGPSSFKMISQIRKITGVKKVGHAGTLDPLASGVLVVAIGRDSTKKISQMVTKEKEYVADIMLGYESTTDDSESEKILIDNSKKITKKEVIEILKKFQGEIDQVPPRFSAIKVSGVRAYKSARQGKEVELKSRKVLVKEIEIIGYRWPKLKLRIVTGPGTYIRSLARDIGRELGCGGYMSDLVRTRVGEYKLASAVDLDDSRQIKEFTEKLN